MPLVIHVDHPAGPRLTILGKTCRLCLVCEMLIAHEADISRLLIASGVVAESGIPPMSCLEPSNRASGGPG